MPPQAVAVLFTRRAPCTTATYDARPTFTCSYRYVSRFLADGAGWEAQVLMGDAPGAASDFRLRINDQRGNAAALLTMAVGRNGQTARMPASRARHRPRRRMPGPMRHTTGAPDMAIKAIPDGYHSVTPYLIVSGAAEAIEFYKKAFGATELMRMPTPDGKVVHAEIRIGDSAVMLADETDDMKGGAYRSPKSLGACSTSLMVYVPDVDRLHKQAVAAGARELRPPENQFYGDRSATLADPFGHVWTIATHVEDVAPDEMERRAAKLFGKG